jgi:hypothetical protein
MAAMPLATAHNGGHDLTMYISSTKWLSLAIGGFGAAAVFGFTETLIPREIANPLFLFAIMMLMDGAFSFKVIPFATIRGPQERQEEVERRFYGWSRTTPRYIYIGATSLVAIPAVQSFGLGDFYLYGMIAVIAGYGLLAMVQVFKCRKEASALYPPDVG